MESLIWPFVLLMLVVLLIFLEIFVPSGGDSSVLAAASADRFHRDRLLAGSLATGTLTLLTATVIIPIVIGVAIKWWPHTPLGRIGSDQATRE